MAQAELVAPAAARIAPALQRAQVSPSAIDLKLLSGYAPIKKTEQARNPDVKENSGTKMLLEKFRELIELRKTTQLRSSVDVEAYDQNDLDGFLSFLSALEHNNTFINGEEMSEHLGPFLHILINSYPSEGLVVDLSAFDANMKFRIKIESAKNAIILPNPNATVELFGQILSCQIEINTGLDIGPNWLARGGKLLANGGKVNFIDHEEPNDIVSNSK